MMVYKYRLHDPDSGKVLYEGTAADLAAQGVVVSEKVLPTLWRDQQRQTRQALDGLAERAWMVEASRKRVGCLPLAPAEVEKRIQTVLQAPAMPESWERRRAR